MNTGPDHHYLPYCINFQRTREVLNRLPTRQSFLGTNKPRGRQWVLFFHHYFLIHLVYNTMFEASWKFWFNGWLNHDHMFMAAEAKLFPHKNFVRHKTVYRQTDLLTIDSFSLGWSIVLVENIVHMLLNIFEKSRSLFSSTYLTRSVRQ